MSVSAAGVSVISLGLSCQTSHQLRRQLPALPGQDFAIDAQYFDYIITPFDTLLDILAGDFADISSAGQIAERLGHAYWPATGVFFPHNFRTGMMVGALDIQGRFAASAAKIAHLRAKFQALDSTPSRLVFVIGNAQADLAFFAETAIRRQELFGFHAGRITACRNALALRYGRRFQRLVVVENTQTDSGDWQLPDVSRYNSRDLAGPADALWEGSDDVWQSLLSVEMAQILAR